MVEGAAACCHCLELGPGGNVKYVDTKRAGELLGLSGLQLPRGPSLNTDRKEILTMKKHSLETHYPIRQEQIFVAGRDQMPELGTLSDRPPYLLTPKLLTPQHPMETITSEPSSEKQPTEK